MQYTCAQAGIRTFAYMYNHTDLNISHPLPVSMVLIIQIHTVTHSMFINQFKTTQKSHRSTYFKESFDCNDYYTSTTSLFT